jgi:LuxR family transcriptional regulator, maltose regulon positive regulatory protein
MAQQMVVDEGPLMEGPASVARLANRAANGALVPPSVLGPPTARPGMVARPGLVDRLAGSLAARLVLVVAPAGWGKTSLLREWLAAQDSGAAWLSVREDDNDPAAFWSGVIAALGSVAPGTGAAALEALAALGGGMPGRALTLLIADLARLPGPVTLVVDDFHRITSPRVLVGVALLAEHLAPGLSVVVSTRQEPGLPLARLRASGKLAEIRAGQLGFSEAEAEMLLNHTLGLTLPPEDVHALWQRTEGWPAGLYLAGLPLRSRTDGHQAVGALADGDQHVFDYLAAEVLAGLPPRLRGFMLRTSVLDRFCAPLCDAVMGSADAADLLEEAGRRQLFVAPLDAARGWYRYHTMFAAALRRELDRTEPGLAPLLHRRAATWHRQYGTADSAVEHALASGDWSDARELIAAHWEQFLSDGLAETVAGWVDRLPPALAAGDARMCITAALAASLHGRPEEAERWLAAAETAPPQGRWPGGPASIESAVCSCRALQRWLDGDLAAADRASRRAAELELESGTAGWRARTQALLGAILYWRGHDADARLLLEQVTGPAHRLAGTQTRQLALSCLAAISARHGDDEAADRYAHEAADRPGPCQVSVLADLTLATLLADRGKTAEAESTALAALDQARHHRQRLDTAAALICLANICTRAGRAVDARSRLDEATNLISALPDSGILPGHLADAELLADPPSPTPPSRTRARRADGLTGREAEVLDLLTGGHTNLEIAAKLVISVHTVERHLQNAYRKVGVRNRADAAAYMVRHGD